MESRAELYYLTNQNEKASRDIAELLLLDIEKTASFEKINEAKTADNKPHELSEINFANIFDQASQHRWINDLQYNKVSAQRFDNATVRESFNDGFLLLKQKPYYEELIQLLAIYFETAIPNYLGSEYNYWKINCLPIYHREENCVIRIDINGIPVLSIAEEEGNSLSFEILGSKLPYLNYLMQNGVDLFVNEVSAYKCEVNELFSNKTEGDIIRFFINKEAFKDALDNPLLLSSMRLFNLRMLNNVGNQVTYIRKPYHCLDLADAIINSLE